MLYLRELQTFELVKGPYIQKAVKNSDYGENIFEGTEKSSPLWKFSNYRDSDYIKYFIRTPQGELTVTLNMFQLGKDSDDRSSD